MDKKHLILELKDILASLEPDEAKVTRTISKDDTTYYITRKSGIKLKLIKILLA